MPGFVRSSRFGRKCAFAFALTAAAALLAGCQLAKNQMTHDRSAELDLQDYRDALSPKGLEQPGQAAAELPDFQPVLSTPQELRLPAPLVTVSVNQTVGLRTLLFELAEQAGVDVELDPQIHGSIIFTARDRPFDEVVDRISAMAGLRYTFADNVLRVELDRPYVKSYTVDYLNLDRSAESSIDTSVSVSSQGSGGAGGSSTKGGSSSKVESKFKPDLWKELETNIEQILTSSDTQTSLATLADPVSTPVNPSPPPPPPPPNPDDPASVAPPPLPGSPQVSAMPAAAAPVINVMSASEPYVPNAPAAFSISRQTGVITVFASDRQQRMIHKYMEQFRKLATTQVLIEAKVLEVSLTDEFASGIDWSRINVTGLAHFNIETPSPGLNPATGANLFRATFHPGNDFTAAVDAISRFGTVRALSSPRVTVINNQPAVVNVARNVVFFDIDPQVTPATQNAGPIVTFSSTPVSVPEGVLLNVLPRANPDTGEVFLTVRPTITKINDFVTDPTVSLTFGAAGIVPPAGIADNRVPQVSVQEMDSFVKLQSGQIMVMGGLMKDNNVVSQTGIPLLGDLPYVGRVFKSHGDKVEKSELVIFLRAVVVPGSNVDAEDRRIYNTFGLDRRPARL